MTHLARLLASQMTSAGVGVGAKAKGIKPQSQQVTIPFSGIATLVIVNSTQCASSGIVTLYIYTCTQSRGAFLMKFEGILVDLQGHNPRIHVHMYVSRVIYRISSKNLAQKLIILKLHPLLEFRGEYSTFHLRVLD